MSDSRLHTSQSRAARVAKRRTDKPSRSICASITRTNAS